MGWCGLKVEVEREQSRDGAGKLCGVVMSTERCSLLLCLISVTSPLLSRRARSASWSSLEDEADDRAEG